MKPRSISLEDTDQREASDREITDYQGQTDINEQTALVAIALLQAYLNGKEQGERRRPQNIVIQAKESKVLSILKDFSMLPNELIDGKYFQTNYLQGYGMPKGYRMIFLNEYNQQEVYIDNYIYVNLDDMKLDDDCLDDDCIDDICTGDKTFRNVDTDNLWFALLRQAARAHDYLGFQTLIEFAMHDDLSSCQDIEPKSSDKKHAGFWQSLSRKLFHK